MENNQFSEFNQKYKKALNEYLNDNIESESHLLSGYQLGRNSVADNLGILSVVAIHHDSLIEYLENFKKDKYSEITDKASIFLQEVLAPYQMVAKDFQNAITLINKNILNFSHRIQDLQEREAQLKVLMAKQEASLKEKESLLKEVYHRVKNNLQVVTSLINLQVETIKDLSAKHILIESETRVKSMALIHEMLYQSENLSKIEMPKYMNGLLNYLIEAYSIDINKIKVITDVDQFDLTIDYAIPCGLILNELISNAIKYAFPNKNQGRIFVSLKKIKNDITLTVTDDGIGLKETFDIDTVNTLGLRLIDNLSKQISGTMTLKKQPGTNFIISFKIE